MLYPFSQTADEQIYQHALINQYLNATDHTQKLFLIDDFHNTFGIHTSIDVFHNTFLHLIVRTSSIDIIHVLSTYPVAVNCQNMFGETPLLQAAHNHRTKVVTLLKSFGADPEVKDSLGIGPSDLFDETNIIFKTDDEPLYTFASEKIREITDPASFRKFIEALNELGFGLHSPIDDEGNTLLHLFAMKGSHQALRTLLTYVGPDSFNSQNDFNCTPVMMAILKSRYTIANALLCHGVGLPYQNETLLVMSEKGMLDKFKFPPKTIQKYLYANRMLASSLNNFKIEAAVLSLLQAGFMLDEPILEDEGSLLHWLVIYAPFRVVQRAIQTKRYTSLDPQDKLEQTPLMLAARDGRQKVVSLLFRNGASTTMRDAFGFTPIEHAFTYPHPIQFSAVSAPIQTIGDFMMNWMKPRTKGIELLTDKQKCVKLFHLYTTFIREQKWTYKGVPDETVKVVDRVLQHSYIFDCAADMQSTVNCFDLAGGFGYLLKTYGLKDISLHIYENNIYSKPFTPKNHRIKGDFVCFDPKAHQAMVADGNHYRFGQHCVVKCMGAYYDPTFCCYYTKADDVNLFVETPPPSPAWTLTELQENHEPLVNEKSLSFQNQFMEALERIFLKSQWDIFQRKGKFIIKSKNNQSHLTLYLENDLLTFGDKQGITENTLVKVGVAWKESLPKPIQSLYSVLSLKGSIQRNSSKENFHPEFVSSHAFETARSPRITGN